MFEKEKTTLFETTKSGNNNAFISKALEVQAETTSGNGAKKYSTTGDVFVDQFAKIGVFMPEIKKNSKGWVISKNFRSFAEISKDCETLWADNPEYAVKFIAYLRMITRSTKLNGNSELNSVGAEMRYEGIMRMVWLQIKSPETFWKNVELFLALGSWKDIFQMLTIDLKFHGWEDRKLDWKRYKNLILSGLSDENQSNLIKKYLPSIKAKSKCTTLDSQAKTIIGKWINSFINGGGYDYKKYRNLKTGGNAHEWQKLISQRNFDRIDFNSIHGRALRKLVKSKTFLDKTGLRKKYEAWIGNSETKNVKFTGFVHELFEGLTKHDKANIETVNKQFETLVKKGGENQVTELIVVRDVSGSMGSKAHGTNMSSAHIAKAIALYFSYFLKGKFANAYIDFETNATLHTWKGQTPTDKWFNETRNGFGSTNFQSVIDLFIKMKNQGVEEVEFPKGIICISDGEFNSSGKDTNFVRALKSLKEAGFSQSYVDNFTVVLWDIRNTYYGNIKSTPKFETFGDVKNLFYLSGYSPAAIKFLSSKIKTPRELFDSAMDQKILKMVKI